LVAERAWAAAVTQGIEQPEQEDMVEDAPVATGWRGQEAQRVIDELVPHYNTVRLHSAIGFVTPYDKLAGREHEIWRERARKLEQAREPRRARRHQERPAS
jgi:hypothetical protein